MSIYNIALNFLSYFKQLKYITDYKIDIFNPMSEGLLFNNSGLAGIYHLLKEKNLEDIYYLATVQNCLRINGKHDDIENIGFSNDHLTSFHMLGVFAIGKKINIFKIFYDIYNFLSEFIEIKKIYITIHPEDSISKNMWLKVNKNIKLIEEVDNVWKMSNDGYSGYSTEIYVLHHNQHIEIWNIVLLDKITINNKTTKLDNIIIDSGGGLERLYKIFSHNETVYEENTYNKLIENILIDYTNIYEKNNKNIRIIADHIITIDRIINNNIPISNNSRGYIIKKMIRRVLFYIHKNNINLKTIIYSIQRSTHNPLYLSSLINIEQKSFIKCINVFDKYIKNKKILKENDIFILHDTHGVPYYLTQFFAEKNNIELSNLDQVQQKLEEKKYLESVKKTPLDFNYFPSTQFIRKKNKLEIEKYIFINQDNLKKINQLQKEEKYILFSDKTIFYPTSGGQEHDLGQILDWETKQIIANVKEVIQQKKQIIIYCVAVNNIQIENKKIIMEINEERRESLSIMHTAHHILLNILHKIYNKDLVQISSIIKENISKVSIFHFNLVHIISLEEIQKLLDNIDYENITIEQKEEDFTILFKRYLETKNKPYILPYKNYPPKTYTISINDKNLINSYEICGGTHSPNIKHIKILSMNKINNYTIQYIFQAK